MKGIPKEINIPEENSFPDLVPEEEEELVGIVVGVGIAVLKNVGLRVFRIMVGLRLVEEVVGRRVGAKLGDLLSEKVGIKEAITIDTFVGIIV